MKRRGLIRFVVTKPVVVLVNDRRRNRSAALVATNSSVVISRGETSLASATVCCAGRPPAAIEQRIRCHGSFARLAVAHDEDERVNRLPRMRPSRSYYVE
jgi:hypothetical protein